MYNTQTQNELLKMQETEISEWLESFCTGGQGWESSLAIRTLSRGAEGKHCRCVQSSTEVSKPPLIRTFEP